MMSLPYSTSTFFLLVGLGLILFVLLGIITLTTRFSLRLGKQEPPSLKLLFPIAFLQVVLGSLTVFAARTIHNDPWIDIGAGLGVTILSGLFFIKVMLKIGWKRCLRVWIVAALLQIVLVPLGSGIFLVGWLMLYFFLYPPLL
jgi:hypothetical protein